MTLEELTRLAFEAYEQSPERLAALKRMNIRTAGWSEMHHDSRAAWMDGVREVLRVTSQPGFSLDEDDGDGSAGA